MVVSLRLLSASLLDDDASGGGHCDGGDDT